MLVRIPVGRVFHGTICRRDTFLCKPDELCGYRVTRGILSSPDHRNRLPLPRRYPLITRRVRPAVSSPIERVDVGSNPTRVGTPGSVAQSGRALPTRPVSFPCHARTAAGETGDFIGFHRFNSCRGHPTRATPVRNPPSHRRSPLHPLTVRPSLRQPTRDVTRLTTCRRLRLPKSLPAGCASPVGT